MRGHATSMDGNPPGNNEEEVILLQRDRSEYHILISPGEFEAHRKRLYDLYVKGFDIKLLKGQPQFPQPILVQLIGR